VALHYYDATLGHKNWDVIDPEISQKISVLPLIPGFSWFLKLCFYGYSFAEINVYWRWQESIAI